MFGLPRRSQPDIAPRRRKSSGDTSSRHERATSSELDSRYTFRRNHTITGSTSAGIMAPNEHGAQIKSPRAQTHDLTRHRRRIFFALCVVVVAAGTLFTLVSQFSASAKVIIDGDESIVAKSDYQEAIQHYLGGSPIERLRFALDDHRLTLYLQKEHPEIAKVAVDGSGGFGVSRFVITTRQAVVSWTIAGVENYVDHTGVSFKVNYGERPAVQIVDQSGVRLKSGQTLASDSFLSFVGQVVGLSKSLEGLTLTKVIIPSGMTREIEVAVYGASYPIKLSTDRPVGQQVEDMARAIAWMQKQGATPLYIDVRVSRAAFYRL